ncbi:MAG: metallophosphoesterase [Nanoarchaeota archaeon]
MNEEILKIIKEKGLLLEKEVYDLFNNIHDAKLAKGLLEGLERFSGQKMITKSVLNKNFSFVRNFVSNLPGEDRISMENIIVKLGLSLEIIKERSVMNKVESDLKKENKDQDYKIFYSTIKHDKKLTVEDFVGNFRMRYHQLQRILMQRPDLQNLVSINKIGSERRNYTIIGIVSEKRVTKNKNIIIKFEDLTGEISVLARANKPEAHMKAEELLLDDVVAVKASGSREILFVNDILFPDSFLLEKIKFNEDVNVAFLSDVHAGGSKHLEKSFSGFIEWLGSEEETAKKIKYIFISGDNVDGVGIFPGQEALLKLKSMREQYALLASYLKKVPKRITMFMCPGQHDAVRVAEPQPIIGRRYAEPLYEIENLILVSNPALIKLIEKEKEFKILMYHGDSIHTFIHDIPELREMKAQRTPAKAVRHMLKRRHLFPIHSEAVYIPDAEKDNLVIGEVPDVVCTGEVHRVDVENYNGTLIITGSCWQGQTAFEEKVGNIPDPCKVPILSLKTRELKVLDFGNEEELRRLHTK